MLFNSWEFVFLLLVTLAAFYSVGDGPYRFATQSVILLIASTIFYGWEDWRLLGLLVVSCGGNTYAAIRILRMKMAGEYRAAGFWVVAAVVLNLVLLGVFKYAGLLVSLWPWGDTPPAWVSYVCEIPLPIGISFYTFHGISMVVDMSRGKVHAYDRMILEESRRVVYRRAFRDMGLYLLFFPQLIAGPIIKAHFFWPQLKAKFWCRISWGRAFRYLVTGYFLKMVVADNLATTTDVLRSMEFIDSSSGVVLLILLFGYSIQIFADFGGYSMIALGLAALFGYRFPINFNFPYISTSLTKFWGRWNMTLSSWLRDYLYIPLGGNRKGSVRTYVNLFLVMFLGGLWHGADWKFALWGSLHGLFLALERFVSHSQWGKGVRIPKWISIPYCFLVVTALWTTFLMPDVETVGCFFLRVVTHFAVSPSELMANPAVYSVLFFSSFVVLYHVWGLWQELRCRDRVLDRGRLPLWGSFVYGFMLFMILTNSGTQCGFVYFQF